MSIKHGEATRAVMSTGRNRVSAPWRMAFAKRSPSCRSLPMKVTITSPLSAATPERAMNPTPAKMESGVSCSRRLSTPPVKVNGTLVKTSQPSLRLPKVLYRKDDQEGDGDDHLEALGRLDQRS